MSVRIRVSYNHPDELKCVLELLRPVIKSCKVIKGQQGEYNKAYIKLNK